MDIKLQELLRKYRQGDESVLPLLVQEYLRAGRSIRETQDELDISDEYLDEFFIQEPLKAARSGNNYALCRLLQNAIALGYSPGWVVNLLSVRRAEEILWDCLRGWPIYETRTLLDEIDKSLHNREFITNPQKYWCGLVASEGYRWRDHIFFRAVWPGHELSRAAIPLSGAALEPHHRRMRGRQGETGETWRRVEFMLEHEPKHHPAPGLAICRIPVGHLSNESNSKRVLIRPEDDIDDVIEAAYQLARRIHFDDDLDALGLGPAASLGQASLGPAYTTVEEVLQ